MYKAGKIFDGFFGDFGPHVIKACGGGNGSASTQTGVAQVSLTDAPGDFDHVWITVKDVWFHTSDVAGPNDPGWLKYPLSRTSGH
jgi:hypothetical protein